MASRFNAGASNGKTTQYRIQLRQEQLLNGSTLGKLVILATIRAPPFPMTGSDDTDFLGFIQTIRAKSKTAITTPGEPLFLRTDETGMKLLDGAFPWPEWWD